MARLRMEDEDLLAQLAHGDDGRAADLASSARCRRDGDDGVKVRRDPRDAAVEGVQLRDIAIVARHGDHGF